MDATARLLAAKPVYHYYKPSSNAASHKKKGKGARKRPKAAPVEKAPRPPSRPAAEGPQEGGTRPDRRPAAPSIVPPGRAGAGDASPLGWSPQEPAEGLHRAAEPHEALLYRTRLRVPERP